MIIGEIMTKISIIMPVYNACEFLEKTIESVSKQTLNDIELICVDDGSTDGSLNILMGLKDSYDFLKVIQQENQGASAARNNGMKNASGEFVGFLDSDDIFLDENALEEMYNLAVDKGLDVVSANLTFVTQDFVVEENPHYEMGDYAYFDSNGVIHPKDYGIPYCFYKIIYRREFLNSNNIDFPLISAGEDPIFLAEVFANTSQIGTVPLTLYGYNHTVGGGVNVKINSYEHKMDYVQHFHDVCDILDEAGLHETSAFYKIHLFRFLTWAENNQDPELFEVFDEVWGIDNRTFDESDFNYTRFIVPAKFYFILKYASEEFFIKVNRDFLQMNIYDTIAIDEVVINEYFMVIFAYSFDDFKKNCVKYLNNNIEFRKEFEEYKIRKFIFNFRINDNHVVRTNGKLALQKCSLGVYDSLSKNDLKTFYEIVSWQV
jgi:glycosyltransferase involved in cell wall biosynthesis